MYRILIFLKKLLAAKIFRQTFSKAQEKQFLADNVSPPFQKHSPWVKINFVNFILAIKNVISIYNI